MKKLQGDIASAKANRDRLAGKLAESETAITERRAQAMQLARDGAEDGALDKAEAAIRSAQDRRTTLSAALGDVEAQLAALEKTFAENADRIQRGKTGAEVEQLARRWTDACAALVDAATKLGDYGERVSMIVPEAAAAWHFSKTIINEIPQNAELITRLLRQHAAAVIAGHAAAALPVPPPAYVAPPVPAKEPVQVLFCLRSVKWREGEGVQRIAAQFTDAQIPARLVGKALKSGACVGLDHPARKTNRTQGGQARLDTAFDLDADEQPRLADPILQSSPFETPTVGPARVLKIATRSSDPNEVR